MRSSPALNETMSASGIASLQTQDLPGHHAGAVQLDEAVHGAHEQILALAPAHELRDGQLLDGGLHYAGQVYVEGLASLARAEHEVLGLAVVHLRERVHPHAAGAREALQRLGRLAVAADARGHGRTLALDFALGLFAPGHPRW